MTDYMMAGLVKKRAEIPGEIANIHGWLNTLVNGLKHIDATLRIVAPVIKVESIRPSIFRPPADWSQRGQMSCIMLSLLRQAKEPLTSREISAQLILERGMAMNTKLLRIMTKRCATSLRLQRDNGTVVSVQGPGQYHLWEVKR